jgi:hypothetical protein
MISYEAEGQPSIAFVAGLEVVAWRAKGDAEVRVTVGADNARVWLLVLQGSFARALDPRLRMKSNQRA